MRRSWGRRKCLAGSRGCGAGSPIRALPIWGSGRRRSRNGCRPHRQPRRLSQDCSMRCPKGVRKATATRPKLPRCAARSRNGAIIFPTSTRAPRNWPTSCGWREATCTGRFRSGCACGTSSASASCRRTSCPTGCAGSTGTRAN